MGSPKIIADPPGNASVPQTTAAQEAQVSQVQEPNPVQLTPEGIVVYYDPKASSGEAIAEYTVPEGLGFFGRLVWNLGRRVSRPGEIKVWTEKLAEGTGLKWWSDVHSFVKNPSVDPVVKERVLARLDYWQRIDGFDRDDGPHYFIGGMVDDFEGPMREYLTRCDAQFLSRVARFSNVAFAMLVDRYIRGTVYDKFMQRAFTGSEMQLSTLMANFRRLEKSGKETVVYKMLGAVTLKDSPLYLSLKHYLLSGEQQLEKSTRKLVERAVNATGNSLLIDLLFTVSRPSDGYHDWNDYLTALIGRGGQTALTGRAIEIWGEWLVDPEAPRGVKPPEFREYFLGLTDAALIALNENEGLCPARMASRTKVFHLVSMFLNQLVRIASGPDQVLAGMAVRYLEQRLADPAIGERIAWLAREERVTLLSDNVRPIDYFTQPAFARRTPSFSNANSGEPLVFTGNRAEVEVVNPFRQLLRDLADVTPVAEALLTRAGIERNRDGNGAAERLGDRLGHALFPYGTAEMPKDRAYFVVGGLNFAADLVGGSASNPGTRHLIDKSVSCPPIPIGSLDRVLEVAEKVDAIRRAANSKIDRK